MGYLLYPYFLVVFWYRDFFLGSVRRSAEIFVYIAELLSVPLLLKTFFKPLKSEYREGLVGFSIIMGIAVKSILLLVTFAFLIIAVVVLLALNISILILPVLIVRFLI